MIFFCQSTALGELSVLSGKYERHNRMNEQAPVTNREKIKAKVGRAQIAAKLAEEGNELSQAAWKLYLVEDQNNLVRMSKDKVLEHLIEEMADVSLCLELLELDTGLIRMKVAQVKHDKAARWEAALERVE